LRSSQFGRGKRRTRRKFQFNLKLFGFGSLNHDDVDCPFVIMRARGLSVDEATGSGFIEIGKREKRRQNGLIGK
jgi:hypothetical protein